MFWNKKKKIINIMGMSCKKCVDKITYALMSIPEIDKVKINLNKKEATVYYSTNVNDDDIRKKIEELDYQVTGIRNVN